MFVVLTGADAASKHRNRVPLLEIGMSQIWHDDLGCEEDRHELRVLLSTIFDIRPPLLARVTAGDVAVAATRDSLDWMFEAEFFKTIRLLLAAGF